MELFTCTITCGGYYFKQEKVLRLYCEGACSFLQQMRPDIEISCRFKRTEGDHLYPENSDISTLHVEFLSVECLVQGCEETSIATAPEYGCLLLQDVKVCLMTQLLWPHIISCVTSTLFNDQGEVTLRTAHPNITIAIRSSSLNASPTERRIFDHNIFS